MNISVNLKVISEVRVKGQSVWGLGNGGYRTGFAGLKALAVYLAFKFVVGWFIVVKCATLDSPLFHIF